MCSKTFRISVVSENSSLHWTWVINQAGGVVTCCTGRLDWKQRTLESTEKCYNQHSKAQVTCSRSRNSKYNNRCFLSRQFKSLCGNTIAPRPKRTSKTALLPENFAQLQQLHTLYLYSKQLSQLPENFAQLQQLQELHLDNKQLTKIDLVHLKARVVEWAKKISSPQK